MLRGGKCLYSYLYSEDVLCGTCGQQMMYYDDAMKLKYPFLGDGTEWQWEYAESYYQYMLHVIATQTVPHSPEIVSVMPNRLEGALKGTGTIDDPFILDD